MGAGRPGHPTLERADQVNLDNSVHVILRVCPKRVDGQKEAARRRIAEALEVDEDKA